MLRLLGAPRPTDDEFTAFLAAADEANAAVWFWLGLAICAACLAWWPTDPLVYPGLPELQAVLGRHTRSGMLLRTDSDFCNYLLQDFEVAVVPGSVFGLAPYFRISYATSMAQLEEACARIAAACEALE